MTLHIAKNIISTLGLFVTAVVTLQPVYAESKAALLPIIQSNYDRINAAFVRKDIKGATAYFTPDYVSINPKGEKQNLEEFRSHYNTVLNRFNIKLTSNKTTIKDLAVSPTGIDVSIVQQTEGTIAGFNKIVINQTSKNFWLKTPQGWRLKQSKILTNQTTFNGKVFND